ncbi:hypothetical protein [Hymenobacter saemangeumensis]
MKSNYPLWGKLLLLLALLVAARLSTQSKPPGLPGISSAGAGAALVPK